MRWRNCFSKLLQNGAFTANVLGTMVAVLKQVGTVCSGSEIFNISVKKDIGWERKKIFQLPHVEKINFSMYCVWLIWHRGLTHEGSPASVACNIV